MKQQYDVVIAGAGVNSLVAAAKLSKEGKSVALIDQGDRIGGFIDSGELISPGYIHDTYSSWHPLFVLGAGYAELGDDLHRLGLEYCNTEGTVTGSVARDAQGNIRTVIAYRDPEFTAAQFEYPEDQDSYLKMLHDLDSWAPVIFGALGSELAPLDLVKLGSTGFKSAKISGMLRLLRQTLMSGRNYTRSTFVGHEVDQLWTPWLLHAGLSPDAATGGIMLPVMAGSMHQAGLPIVKGGAANFVRAFQELLESQGVHIVTGERIDQVNLEQDRAVGVRTAKGNQFGASEGVFVSTGAKALYEDLLPQVQALEPARQEVRSFQSGRGAVQVHLTLSGSVPWLIDELKTTPLIHVSDGSDSTAIACAQAEAGYLPTRPTIVVGQQHVLDPSRVPEGAATLWLQLQEAPYRPLGDSAGVIDVSRGWSDTVKEQYLSRVLDVLEEFAPGLSSLVQGSIVISPVDLEDANPNAVAGDPYGGSAEIYQNLLFRPSWKARGWGNPVKKLYHIGAAVHPGPGLGAGSGYLAAEKLLKRKGAFGLFE